MRDDVNLDGTNVAMGIVCFLLSCDRRFNDLEKMKCGAILRSCEYWEV